MNVPMATTSNLATTPKDFRDYVAAGAFAPPDFTRILDADLGKIWRLINDMGGVCLQPRFERSGAQVRLREILTWGSTVGHNKMACITPRVPRDPAEVVAKISNWKHACERGVVPAAPEVLLRLDDALMRPLEV
jgi:hypothetical protein